MSNINSSGGTNLRAVKDAVARMVRNGVDVGLRNAYGSYGLSNASESIDLSPLLPPRDLRRFVEGFERALWYRCK